jgi:hypothetical protein
VSDSLAIAAVTTTLRNLLDAGLNADVSGTTITTRPLDRARQGINGNQINLFLYHTVPNAAWRNMDIPWKVRPGETGQPPLPLILYYLVTAFYGEDEDSVDTTTDANRILGSHRLLGRAMSILHDHPLLDNAAINSILPSDDLLEHPYDQLERVRITPQPLSLDEMYKLWGGFQTQYRLSAAYELSVVLIESVRPARAPLPVLRRGSQDQGVFTQPGLSPTLFEVRLPNGKPAAELGDTLELRGTNLDAGNLTARMEHTLLEVPIDLAPLPGATFDTLRVQLPDTSVDPNVPSLWPGGIYTLSILVQKPSLPVWTSNAIPFALAPQITLLTPSGGTAPAGDLNVSLECIPQIRAEQRATLLFGDRQVQPGSLTTPADPTAPSTLAFLIENIGEGVYVLRLRVHGVDSIPVDFSATPPAFAASQKVTITP